MKNKQHNSRRRRRDYGSTMHNLAYAMVRGDVDSVKDCFETVNRGIFAFNQALDKMIFEPVANYYLNYKTGLLDSLW